MDKTHAQEDIKLIREIMERSTRYTHFSGLSGILSGLLAFVGIGISCWITYHVPVARQNALYIITWISVLILALAQDLILADRKAKRNGATIWCPATYSVFKAVFPGVLVAFVLSLVALYDGALDAIPAVWALGYGTSLCAAGMFSVREVWVYGVIQLLTGTAGLFLMSEFPNSLYLLVLSFGVYQIAFGIVIARKYR